MLHPSPALPTLTEPNEPPLVGLVTELLTALFVPRCIHPRACAPAAVIDMQGAGLCGDLKTLTVYVEVTTGRFA
jgi:hypothetical protein